MSVPSRLALRGFLLLAPLLLALPARADVDATAIGRDLADAVAATGRATLSFDSATASGDTATFSGVKIATNRNGYTITVPSMVIAGIVPKDGGGFSAKALSFDGGSAQVRGQTTAWQAGALSDIVVPSADDVRAGKNLSLFRAVNLSDITISGPDLLAPITVETASLALGDPDNGTKRTVTGKASGIHLPTALLSRTFLGAIIHQLDYEEFVAEADLDAVHDSANDTAVLNALSLNAIGAGKITASGRTSDVSLAALLNPETFAEAKSNARFDSLTVRIDNAGFVERVLGLEAEMLGYTPEEVRAAWTDGALPIALSVVKDERFRNQMQTAVSAFLADPRSLTLKFEPQTPVPVGQLARTALKTPTKLPDLLTPTVEANN